MIATKCGGTDATSGLAANPAVGNMVDRVIAEGGSGILSELNELVGTEHVLARRAVSEEVAQKVYSAIYEVENLLRSGLDFSLPENRNHLISRGNFAGGISSIVKKGSGRRSQIRHRPDSGRAGICDSASGRSARTVPDEL